MKKITANFLNGRFVIYIKISDYEMLMFFVFMNLLLIP
jgi:hypothetical protein